jgi:hypothetical protein
MKNVAAAIIDFYRDPVILKEFEEWKEKEKENENGNALD